MLVPVFTELDELNKFVSRTLGDFSGSPWLYLEWIGFWAIHLNISLTTSVDSFNGGAGDDTFAAIMATASTYNVGDSVNGGAGTDTLNIIDVSGTAASVVSLDGVEIVNVRSLVGTGTDVTELDASDWDGVTKLTNASSIAGSELQVSGLSISTHVNLIGNTDVSIDFFYVY